MESLSSPRHAWNESDQSAEHSLKGHFLAQLLLIIHLTYCSPNMEEFRDKDLGERS